MTSFSIFKVTHSCNEVRMRKQLGSTCYRERALATGEKHSFTILSRPSSIPYRDYGTEKSRKVETFRPLEDRDRRPQQHSEEHKNTPAENTPTKTRRRRQPKPMPPNLPTVDEHGNEISYTPVTHRPSKAKKGKKVHACEYPRCGKVQSRSPLLEHELTTNRSSPEQNIRSIISRDSRLRMLN